MGKGIESPFSRKQSMNKEASKRLGRPPGSLNKPKPAQESATHTLITIPKALALKIATLSARTGVNPDRIALAALVDGLNKWEGVHETLISYNESVDAIIRASSGPARKRTRHAAAPSFTVAASPGDAVTMEDTLGLTQTGTTSGDNGADQPKTGAASLSPDDHALFGRDPGTESKGVDSPYDQFIHGE